MIKKILIALLVGICFDAFVDSIGGEDWYRGYCFGWSSIMFLYIYDAVQDKRNKEQGVEVCDATKSN